MRTFRYSWNQTKPVEEEKDKILRQLNKEAESWEVREDGRLYITFKEDQ